MSPSSNNASFSNVVGNGINTNPVNGHTMNGNGVNGNLSSSMNSSNGLSQSPFGGGVFGLNGYEVQRLKDELIINKAKMTQWEDGMAQARNVRITFPHGTLYVYQ